MWRIMGLIFFGDRNHFWNEAERKFMIEPIKDFLTEKGIAMYDTAYKVERLKDIGLDVPPMTELAHRLRAHGIDVHGAPMNVEEMVEELCRLKQEN